MLDIDKARSRHLLSLDRLHGLQGVHHGRQTVIGKHIRRDLSEDVMSCEHPQDSGWGRRKSSAYMPKSDYVLMLVVFIPFCSEISFACNPPGDSLRISTILLSRATRKADAAWNYIEDPAISGLRVTEISNSPLQRYHTESMLGFSPLRPTEHTRQQLKQMPA